MDMVNVLTKTLVSFGVKPSLTNTSRCIEAKMPSEKGWLSILNIVINVYNTNKLG
jgi:hypothetical protein